MSLKFMELFKAGKVMEEEIDDYVDLWHESETQLSLPDFLGMTEEQYQVWALTCRIEI